MYSTFSFWIVYRNWICSIPSSFSVRCMRRQQRCWLWCSVFVLGYLLWRGFPFFIDTIPLWYDPGLYKAMMLAYYDLGQWWNFSQLPWWIRGMYEPLLGMRASIWQQIIWSRSDQVMMWGWVVISGLLPLGAYLCGSLWGRRVGLFAVVGVLLSFVQYELFWRAYRKQLIGMFFLLVCLRWWMRGLRRSLIPLICAIVLVSRPVAIVGLLCWLLIFGQTIKKQWRREVWVLSLVFVCSMIVVLPVLQPFLDSLIVPLIGPFFEAIDLPQWHDTFQAGGTFLTIREYLMTARPILISGSIGAVLLILRRHWVIFGWMVIVLSMRVFGQFYFSKGWSVFWIFFWCSAVRIYTVSGGHLGDERLPYSFCWRRPPSSVCIGYRGPIVRLSNVRSLLFCLR